jgi:DNA-binding MarR family transcriptional regulator
MLAVAGYRMMRSCVAEAAGIVFVPTRQFFQAPTSIEAFEDEVFREVAQTLIDNVEAFRRAEATTPNITGLDKWLNSPQYRSGSATVMSVGAGAGSVPNTAEGFAESGFQGQVRNELRRCFPSPAAGAVVCVLDNLELLQTSAQARETLEALRDRVFQVDGLRWVLCGSRGIVSRARSERLSGVFEPPVRLGPLTETESVELIERRLTQFGDPGAYAPVTPEAFEYLYQAVHSNLRDAMAYAQQFSDWLYAEYLAAGIPLPEESERRALLEVWMAEIAEAAQRETRVQPRVWSFFEGLAASGGRCRASDWEQYGFSTQQQMVRAVTDLVSTNLLVRETDPENAARSFAALTPQGWLVAFARNDYRPIPRS